MRDGDRFQLYATYPICFWSGKLGPKEREGDRQAPEGFTPWALSSCVSRDATLAHLILPIRMLSTERLAARAPISWCTVAALRLAALP